VEGASRRKTPNEIALNILLAALTLVFLVVCATLRPMSAFAAGVSGSGAAVSLAPWPPCSCAWRPPPSGGCCRPSASRAWTRLIRAGVIATSGRAV
jgi:K+-transporting ATPase ATPase B chain